MIRNPAFEDITLDHLKVLVLIQLVTFSNPLNLSRYVGRRKNILNFVFLIDVLVFLQVRKFMDIVIVMRNILICVAIILKGKSFFSPLPWLIMMRVLRRFRIFIVHYYYWNLKNKNIIIFTKNKICSILTKIK